MSGIIRKVASFVCKENDRDEHLLLVFDDPLTGLQLPAGTVNPGERIEKAARREILEETGVHIRTEARLLGSETKRLAPKRARMIDTIETEETGDGFGQQGDPIVFERGHRIELLERDSNRWRVRESVLDHTKDPAETVDQKVGWVRMDAVTTRLERTFFLFRYQDEVSRISETHSADGHEVEVQWVSLQQGPKLFGQQSDWFEDYLQSPQ